MFALVGSKIQRKACQWECDCSNHAFWFENTIGDTLSSSTFICEPIFEYNHISFRQNLIRSSSSFWYRCKKKALCKCMGNRTTANEKNGRVSICYSLISTSYSISQESQFLKGAFYRKSLIILRWETSVRLSLKWIEICLLIKICLPT